MRKAKLRLGCVSLKAAKAKLRAHGVMQPIKVCIKELACSWHRAWHGPRGYHTWLFLSLHALGHTASHSQLIEHMHIMSSFVRRGRGAVGGAVKFGAVISSGLICDS